MTLTGRMTVAAGVACLLASTALVPLYTGGTWFAAAAGAVITVAAAGALTRLRALPVAACLAGSAAALLLYLNLVFEARHSLLLVIPTPGSLTRLWQLAGTGMHDANRDAPPVLNVPGLLLLAAGGVGITAVLTDLIAVRLRSAALAGLPLLVLFTVPVMMNAPHGAFITVLVFCLGTAGYLAMLSADGRERIRVWGRLVSLWRTGPRHGSGPGGRAFDGDEPSGLPRGVRERRHGPDTRALAVAGRRVGLASMVLALCVPLLLPGLHPSKVLSSGPGIGGDGGVAGSLTLPSALQQTVTQLHESRPAVLFTYTTSASAAQQDGYALYLRQYVFDTLTDGGWVVDDYGAGASPVGGLPNPQGLSDTTTAETVTTRVSVSRDFSSPSGQPAFLPLPYPPIHVNAPGTWVFDSDEMVYSTSDSITGRSYSVASVRVDPGRAQLEGAPGVVLTPSLRRDLQLPAQYQTAALKSLAASAAAGRSTEFGKVDALANWLSGGEFTYSLTAKPVDSPAGLLSFLTTTRSGFCVQYAYAMTVLTRLLGIPARFVSGFTAGTLLANGSYQVKTTDAHAWTEVYFPGLGWIRFEPTPAGQGTANSPNYMTGPGGRASGGNSSPVPGASATPGTSGTKPGSSAQDRIRRETGFGETVTGPAGRRAGTSWPAVALAAIAAIVLAFGLITVVNPAGRRVMPGHPARAARHRRPLTTTAGILAAAAALLALALYRLLGHTPGLDIKAGWATVGVAFGATAAAILITPGAFRLVLRRWRWMRAGDDAGRAHAAWREFHDDLADFGVACRPSEPPRTLATRVTATLPGPAAAAVTRLALAEERASYAARPGESAHLRRDGTAARRGLAATARRPARWRAMLFPASMLATLAETASRIPDQVSALRPRRPRRSARP